MIHISSGAAHKNIAGWGTYCVSKGALLDSGSASRMRTLEHDIAMASVRRGVVDTEMQQVIRDAQHSAFVARPYFESLKKRVS